MTLRAPQSPVHDAALQRAVVHHQAGRLAEAEPLYRAILQAEPQHADANHYLGLLTAQRGRPELGLPFLKAALDANPGKIQYWLSFGEVLLAVGQAPTVLALMQQARQCGFSGPAIEGLTARATAGAPASAAGTDAAGLYASARQLHQAGRLAEAIGFYDRALAARPDYVEAHNNLGNALAQLGRLDEAVASYGRALAARPAYVEAHSNLGNVLAQHGRLEEAAASYAQAIAIRPDYAEAHSNLGNVLAYQGRLDEAVASYDRAIALKPDHADAHYNIGNVFMRQNRLEEFVASYRRALVLKPDHAKAYNHLGTVLCATHHVDEGFAAFTRHAELVYGSGRGRMRNSEPVPPHRMRHDQAQREYLTSIGVPDDGRSIDEILHLADGRRLAGPAVNPGNAVGEISGRWRRDRPQIAVVDNLLTDEALEGLRRFCWGSTIWRKNYEAGYVAALLEYGFSCPLLAQIADELRQVYPAIFGAHPLLHLWAFKYDSRLTGVALHADNAAINVNFWITPDEANLEPGTGGLIVWDVPAPLDWDYYSYNGDLNASRDFLARNGAKSVTVPYRSNRAVIFDSDLFHETDRIAFKDGYTDRRINVTLLYGRREAGDGAV